ncbi:MAG: hypothetical protein ACYC9Q_01030 [Bacillota bacterium]
MPIRPARDRSTPSGKNERAGSKPLRPRPARRGTAATVGGAGREKPAQKPTPPPSPRPAEPEEEVLLKWSVHLARQYPRRTFLTALGVVATLAVVLLAGLGPWWAFITVVIIVGSISAWIFPIRYALTNKGVKQFNFLSREERSWLRFTNYIIYNDAVQVTYDQRTLRGRILKGLMLYFGPDNRERIIEVVKDNVVTEDELAALADEEPEDNEEDDPQDND